MTIQHDISESGGVHIHLDLQSLERIRLHPCDEHNNCGMLICDNEGRESCIIMSVEELKELRTMVMYSLDLLST